MAIQKLDVPAATLGEGAIWSERDSCFYFVDIVGHRVCRYRPDDGTYRHWQFSGFVGSLAECESGGLVVALVDRVVHFKPETGVAEARDLVMLERDRPRNRLNDGKPDPWGHFWVGSMQVDELAPSGRLWRVSAAGEARCVRDGITISNGIAFDGERGRIYFADSKTGVIECAELDQHHLPKSWRPFAKAEAGVPDGSAVDADGCLWNAEWDGRRLTRYTPDGQIDRVVEIPTRRPTCPAFGGADLCSLFVTSANHNLTAAERLSDPHAGAAFLLGLDDVQGLPPNLFAL
ncbi:MAG TPA: SMP-30/gluconolactonase/LRE family protein [Polyangia bacterium]|jgi:sugar lactone lactonase YvrE|nr:SMP-30/gluconolactonase/LRE family protein [Polyangia bacterium]